MLCTANKVHASLCLNHTWEACRRYLSCSPRIAAKHSRPLLPSSPARTRFAPSPTGFLHLGSLRTALFNYLLAKKTGGQFLLRIEDTDQKRTVPGAIERLCEDLQWAGLQWDEGPDTKATRYGSYKQSERTELYQEHAQKLLDTGHAYRCFCSAERLDTLTRQRQQLGLPTDYDRQCAGIPRDESETRARSGEAHVIRLLAPEVYPEVTDLVYGKIGKVKGPNAGVVAKHGEVAYEDPVLLKTDGRPTYHLANVIDDHFMDITHVVRATEWISSTPKHLALYEAFGWEPPQYAHVGLLVDEAGHKLSKRNLDTDVAHYRDMGILPSTLVNFVALLGWSHTQRSDVMTLDELVNQFRMQFTKGNTTVTLEKLWFLQRAHATRAAHQGTDELDEMAGRVEVEAQKALFSYSPAIDPGFRTAFPNNTTQDQFDHLPSTLTFFRRVAGGMDGTRFCRSLLQVDAKNYTTPEEFVRRNLYFFVEPPPLTAFVNTALDVASTEDLFVAADQLVAIPASEWSVDSLLTRMRQIVRSPPIPKSISTSQEGDQWEKPGSQNHMVFQVTSAMTPRAPLSREKAFNKLFHDFLRWFLLAGADGPASANVMALLGREVCMRRLNNCKIAVHEAELAGVSATDGFA